VALPRFRYAAIATITLLLAGCASSDVENTDGTDDALTGADGWKSIGFGIGGNSAGSGADILVTCGGYSAKDQDSRAWAMALAHSPSFAGLDIGPVYAARGPADASYGGHEIGNSKLVAALAGQVASARFIIVLGHSSGAFVADELITEAPPAVRSKIVYFALDGGTHSLTSSLISEMKAVYFVNAKDAAKGESHNASSMRSLHSEFHASHLFTVNANGSGCNSGATWCLHDTLITTRPHNPNMFDLADDYQQFGGARKVVTSYIDQAVADGVLVASAGAAPEPPPETPPASPATPATPDAPPAIGGINPPGAGQACSSDGQCNPGNDGAGLICQAGVCVAGCHTNAQCAGSTTCVAGQCH
jgi:hypothetical protein